MALSNTFTIGTTGTLDLPILGRVPAAGLRATELAELIADRLQARIGLHNRPFTTVQRKQPPPLDAGGSVERSPVPETRSARTSTDSSSNAASERVHVEGRPAVAQPSLNGSRTSVGTAATEQQQGLEPERSSANTLLRELAAARMETEAAREDALAAHQAAHDDAVRYVQRITAERQWAATLTQGLTQTLGEAHREAARERAKGAALEQNLLVALGKIDALKNSAQSIGEREEVLRRELAGARKELDAARQAAHDAGAQARAVADATTEQNRTLEEQRQRAEGLARDLTLAQREVESMRAQTALAIRERAAAHSARDAADAALADARRALDKEQHKVGLYERDLAAARRSIDALEASANLAAASHTKRAGEALALERERPDSVVRALDTARQERDAAKEEVNRVSAAQSKALEQERDRVLALSRDLTAARKEIDILKARGERRTSRVEDAPKARAPNSARPRTVARSTSKSALREIRKVKERNLQRTVRLTRIVLPDALLPTRPPIRGDGQ
jgi:hypothetical protein